MLFPVSAAIHRATDNYREVLESYSRPLLEFIDWERQPLAIFMLRTKQLISIATLMQQLIQNFSTAVSSKQ